METNTSTIQKTTVHLYGNVYELSYRAMRMADCIKVSNPMLIGPRLTMDELYCVRDRVRDAMHVHAMTCQG